VSFFQNKKKGGPDSFTTKVFKHAILKACTFNTTRKDGMLGSIRHRLGLSKDYFFNFMKSQKDNDTDNQNIHHSGLTMANHNTYERKRNKLQHKSIELFSHSEESLSIDSNSFNVIMVRDSPHLQRVWRVKTDVEQYSLFKQSDIVHDFK
jgi:hypothetical protein